MGHKKGNNDHVPIKTVCTYIQLHHREMSLAQIYYSDWLILFCCINDNLVAKYAYKYIRKENVHHQTPNHWQFQQKITDTMQY